MELIWRSRILVSDAAIRNWVKFESSQGTSILLQPGVITGGKIVHECPLSRSVGYFLEPIVLLAPFCKKSLHLTIKGITTHEDDLSVSYDSFRCTK